MVRSCALAGMMALSLSIAAQAQDGETATPIPDDAKFSTQDGDICVAISATKGWQRFTLPFGAPIDVYFEHLYVDYDAGWTVDKARYEPVGNSGHQGADAAALAPYDGYKYTQKLPFGALLARYGAGLVDLSRDRGDWSLAEETTYIDFRINDTGLGDNAGEIYVCFY